MISNSRTSTHSQVRRETRAQKFELNGVAPSHSHEFTAIGRTLYFAADNGNDGTEPRIWRS